MTTELDPFTWLPIPLATGTVVRHTPTGEPVQVTAVDVIRHLDDGTTVRDELEYRGGGWRA